ncbi:MAG TPA: ATP-binding protein [Pirellulales bacterium]|nr:ATP-binding protein [Pirellulales bacterium]
MPADIGPRIAAQPIIEQPMRVLLVDEQPQDVDRWLAMLEERFGGRARTHVAHTAAEALEILARHPADVVLTEYRLPDADGLGLIASIAARHPEVATILITAHGNEAVAANALKFGARDYLVSAEIDAAALERSILQATNKAALARQQSQRLEQLEQSRHEMDQIVRSLSHDMSAMFMLLDHSFQRLKDAADPIATKIGAADQPPPLRPAGALANAGRQSEAHAEAASPSNVGPLTQQFAHVEACLRESKRFLDDLTTVARTGTVHMEPARVELASVVEEVLFEQREMLAERKVHVDVAADLPAVWCNPLRAKQVLTNMVRNAARHGCDAHEPRITIARRAQSEPAETAFEWITVYDNGPGIPAESREEIFKPGRRLADAHPDGSGMGLSIVRKIVQYYGGQVSVDANCGSGTTFVLSLPKVIGA